MADSQHRSDTAGDKTIVGQVAFGVRSRGELEGQILEIQPGTQVIGRQPGCELRVDDGFVSRRHAIVVRDHTGVTIQDAGSANGTSVNGEPLRGDPRALRSGDAVRVGRIELVYLDGLETPQRRSALLRPPEGAPPIEVLSRPGSDDTPALLPARALPSGRQAAAGTLLPMAPTQLALSAVAAAVTSLVLSGLHVDRLGQSWVGSMGAAALTSVVATVVQARGRGQWWRLAGGAGLAFALAVTGVSLPELGLHRALTSPDRPATFVPPKLTPSTTTEPPPGPRISVDPNPNVCPDLAPGQSAACPVLTIRSSGAAALLVKSFELVGPAAGEFRVDTDATGTSGGDLSCLGRPLAPGDACSVQVSFQPTQAGLRSATLVVHQNLPRPDTGTPVDLIGHGIGEPTTT